MATAGIGPEDTLLLFLPDRTLPDAAWVDRIKATYPGLTVRVESHTDPATGQTRDVNSLSADVWDGVTLLVAHGPPRTTEQKVISYAVETTLKPTTALPGLRFVQVPSAGADRWIAHETLQRPDLTICTGNGTHAPQIAEWVIGAWLMARHHFLSIARHMATGDAWQHRMDHMGEDSTNTRIGILGYGAIGRQVARLATALGMEVYAYTRSERATPASRADPDTYCVPGTGDPEGRLPAQWFHGTSADEVNRFLARDLDLLVVATPLTADTAKLLGPDQFAVLDASRAAKPKTYLVNVARGKVVDTDALLHALHAHQIAGAALDVTDPEPLPASHPLWKAPNVFIAPHVSWQSHHMRERLLGVLELNLQRLHAGRPLVNVLHKALHY
ncbi:2-hydroxyacid dehydrogenase [Sporothrix schenckii 1099-18]|uniref:2-hydroxyacid dehydrogenase n=1 Tax=Sporothrix schenckii 1099-18 TaxID=1397361 RepID=A0A0F2MCU5_SPOSC|nr:2-hydroxyacid dehydrogenase [Sporothrix schenckii 1099-18]KJR87503.1 2-hydroxyacid dehydrogenase [Sporothrix schenckii 1099-18]